MRLQIPPKIITTTVWKLLWTRIIRYFFFPKSPSGKSQLPRKDRNLPRRSFRWSAEDCGALRDPAGPQVLRDLSKLWAQAGLHRRAEEDQHDPVCLRGQSIWNTYTRNRARSHHHTQRVVGSGHICGRVSNPHVMSLSQCLSTLTHRGLIKSSVHLVLPRIKKKTPSLCSRRS